MRRLVIALGFFLAVCEIIAQSPVAVTGTVQDTNGNVYANGILHVSLEDANGNDLSNTPVNVGGVPIVLSGQTSGLSSTGTFNVNVYPNSQIGYTTATKWEFSFCSQIPQISPSVLTPPQTCFENVLTISAAGSITSSLTPSALAVTVPNGISSTNANKINGASIFGASNSPNPVQSGLLAEYQFLASESGTTSVDYSGNNNTCNWSASPHAPARGTTGELKLGYSTTFNYCDTTIPTGNVVSIVAYVSYTVPATSTPYSGVFTNSTATVNLLNSTGGLNATGVFTTYSQSATNFSALPGYGEIGWVRSVTADAIYANGISNMSGTAGPSLGITAGTMYIGTGSANGAITATNVSVHWVDMYSTALTQAQVIAIGNWQAQQVANVKGFSPTPQNNTTAGILDCWGDSITFGQGAASYCSAVSLTTANTYFNSGQPAITMANMQLGLPRIAGLYPPNGVQANVPVFAGTNDISGQSGSGTIVATTTAYLSGAIRSLAAQGWKVFPVTMLARSATDDPHRDTYNTNIRQNWKSWGAAGILDFAASPFLGADGGASSSTTSCSGGAWFQVDLIHPTTCAQTSASTGTTNAPSMQQMASCAINYYYGASSGVPTAQSANSYTMACGDAFLNQTITAGATVTLPECVGITGAVYSIRNINSGSFVLTVSGTGSETITGTATIAANAASRFTATLTSASAAGCFWVAN